MSEERGSTRRTGRDAPLDWGRSREMSALETLMWRAESDPRLRSTICSLSLLDRVPDWDRFVAACDWGTRMAPRFRQKVVEPTLGVGYPRWVNDPDFDLHYHVRRVRLSGDGGWQELLSVAEQLAMTPFDRARSPWETVLFEGLPDGRGAQLMKMHHSTTDGLGGFQLFSELHSTRREHQSDKPQPPEPPPEWVTPEDVFSEQLRRSARSAAGDAIEAAGRVLRGLSNPVDTVQEITRFTSSLRRVLGSPEAEGSPLLRGRSLSWRFMALDVRFPDLRAAAKQVDASLNDAFLSALLGAFRIYHDKLGEPVETIPIAIPISVRTDDDAAGGNKFAGARFAAPVAVRDPVARMHAIGEMVRSARGEPALDAMGAVAPVLTRLPAPLVSAVSGELTQSNDLQASNVPGYREERFIAGARIERVYGFGPLPGCATMITLVTHGDLCCIAANVDRAAVTDPELFGRCLEEGFAEVLATVDAAAPVVRLA